MTDPAIPKILADALAYNAVDVDIICRRLKIPWLTLDLTAPVLAQSYLEDLYLRSLDWRETWGFQDLENNAYQVKGWNGQLLFGPRDLPVFLQDAHTRDGGRYAWYDEDSQVRNLRSQTECAWRLDSGDPIRTWVEDLVGDPDLNMVNTYWLPPGGFVLPHRDYTLDENGLNKIYLAVDWAPGNRFGMYGCGDLPIEQGQVLLINNYTLPHWVYNGSDRKRLVLSMSANLKSPTLERLIVQAYRRTFGMV